MDSFAPELFRLWLPTEKSEDRIAADRRDEESRRQQKALEELAERVTAARTIV